MKRHNYFAFGSNMDPAQMLRRCPSAQRLGTGRLAGYLLAFAGQSRGWGSGVATVQRKPGTRTPGVLWSISAADLAELDRYEGHPVAYQRTEVKILCGSETVKAWAYIKRDRLNPPSDLYLNKIGRAYAANGFDPAGLVAAMRRAYAAQDKARSIFVRVFVYGTLLSGEPNHPLLREARFDGQTTTKPEFTMLNLRAFPGIVSGGKTAIAGECYKVDADTLLRLDRLEGHPSFYRRQQIELSDGRKAYTYILPGDYAQRCERIESGDWIEHLTTTTGEPSWLTDLS